MEMCYISVLNGVPGSKNCEELAAEYRRKYNDPKTAAQKFIDNQVIKCSASGFVTGFGGVITLPVAVPANITSVIYIQMRMVATVAVLGGYDITRDDVQTLIYLCLVQTSVVDIFKTVGVDVANKMATSMLNKLPGSVLTKINQKVGFRLFTKFGTTGSINLVKVVPVAGSLVGGGVDFVGTRAIGKKAYKTFMLDIIE